MTDAALIKELITSIEEKNITPQLLRQLQDGDWKENLWSTLVTYLHQEKNSGSEYLGHAPIFQNDFNTGNSTTYTLFEKINRLADLDSPEGTSPYSFASILSNLYDNGWVSEQGALKNLTPKTYPWNESLANVLTYFLRYFDMSKISQWEGSENNLVYKKETDDKTRVQSNTKGTIPVTNTALNSRGGFRITSVKNANAGHSFKQSPWVIPNYNVDAETYDSVRDSDEILEVLKSLNQMQFTHTQEQNNGELLNKYIRLLMPKYLRYVEVEDLNRNFWVIGQVITAISAYLFDENSPTMNMFKKILNELVQLWENIIYLWATIALLSKKPYFTGLHTEIVYIPNDEWRGYYKFDNFDATNSIAISEIEKRFQYLVDAYKECNLCIVPVVRDENYQHNFYAKEKYPGILFYNRNTNLWTSLTLNITIDLTEGNLQQKVGALRETEEKYYYACPLSKVISKDVKDSIPHRYYGLLRVIPTITAAFDKNNNRINLTNFKLQIHDVATELYTSANKVIRTFSLTGSYNSANSSNISQDVSVEDGQAPSTVLVAQEKDITKGFYQGELTSYFGKSGQIVYKIKVSQVSGPNVVYTDSSKNGDYQVQDTDIKVNWDTIDAIEVQNSSSTLNALKSRNETLIKTAINAAAADAQDTILLYRGTNWTPPGREAMQIGAAVKLPGESSYTYYNNYLTYHHSADQAFMTTYRPRYAKNSKGEEESELGFDFTGNSAWGSSHPQTIIMIKGEDEGITLNNWLVVYINPETGAPVKYYKDSNHTQRTYYERYCYNAVSFSSKCQSQIPSSTDEWLSQLRAIYNTLSATELKKYFGTENKSDYREQEIVTQLTINVFGPGGAYAQKVYSRDEANRGHWKEMTERTIGDINALRNGYKVISNSWSGYNFEKYKSNGVSNAGDDDTYVAPNIDGNGKIDI